ncbi:hypothetical protein Gotur_021553, partial [Gossypium turneri]
MESSLDGARRDPISMWRLRLGPFTWNLESYRIYPFARAMTTPKYYGWWSKRVNDNILGPREECVRSIEEHLQVISLELEIIKQDFEKRSSEL